MAKKKSEGESEGIAEGALRELGFGGLVDSALISPAFQQRFSEVNKEIEERLSKGAAGGEVHPSTRLGIRPHMEGSYSVRYIREEKGREWRPTVKKPVQKPVQKIVAEEPGRAEPLVDVFDEGDHLRVLAELPGVEERDIKAEAKGTVLTISAEMGDKRYSRRVELPTPVTSELTTSYKHGVLEVELKKAK